MKLNRSILNARLAKMRDVMICREVIPDGREEGCCETTLECKVVWGDHSLHSEHSENMVIFPLASALEQ
jgi:hypothetical protein